MRRIMHAVYLGVSVFAAGLPQALYAQTDSSHNVTIVLPETLVTVEPCMMASSSVGRVVKENVTETLTELNPNDGTLLPRLATSWERVDNSTWRFKLRPGVKFHDGADFNAQSVVYTLQRIMDEKLDCLTRSKFFAALKLTPKVVDDLTLDISTVPDQPILPTILSNLAIFSPNTPLGVASQKPAGTGPYVLDSWDPAKNVVLKRFDGYWGEKPEIEQATYVWRAESAIQAAMVATGEADIALSIASQDATNPETDFSYPNSETTRIRIGTEKSPLSDIRIRKALNLAVNRQAFIGSIFSKDVIPASQLVGPSVYGYNPDLKPWPYDPEQAKKLIAEAAADGVDVKKEILLVGRQALYPNIQEVLEALVQMWADVGLNVRLQMFERAQAVKLMAKPYDPNREPSLMVDQHDNNSGDAYFTIAYKYTSNGTQSDFTDPELDKIIAEAGAATGDERRTLYQKAFARITNEIVPDVMLFHMVGYTRVSPRLIFKPTIATNSELQLAQIKFK